MRPNLIHALASSTRLTLCEIVICRGRHDDCYGELRHRNFERGFSSGYVEDICNRRQTMPAIPGIIYTYLLPSDQHLSGERASGSAIALDALSVTGTLAVAITHIPRATRGELCTVWR